MNQTLGSIPEGRTPWSEKAASTGAGGAPRREWLGVEATGSRRSLS